MSTARNYSQTENEKVVNEIQFSEHFSAVNRGKGLDFSTESEL
jgi:hypothetical protein